MSFVAAEAEDSYFTPVADCILMTERKEIGKACKCFSVLLHFLSIMGPPYPDPQTPTPPSPKSTTQKHNPKNGSKSTPKALVSLPQSLSRLMTTPGTVALCSTKETGHYRQMVCVCVHACVCSQVHRQAKRQGHGK